MINGYVITREGQDPTKPRGLFALGLNLRLAGRGGDRYVVSCADGSKKVAYNSVSLAVEGMLERCRKASVNDGFTLVVKANKKVLRTTGVKVVDWTPLPADTNGSPQVDLYVACLNAMWGDKWRSAGSLVCKKTTGTDTWSDHAWGEAQDLFATWEVMDEIADWTVASYADLNVSYVILRDRIWSRKTKKWASYGGVYHNHVHTSFVHDGAGTPPCAR